MQNRKRHYGKEVPFPFIFPIFYACPLCTPGQNLRTGALAWKKRPSKSSHLPRWWPYSFFSSNFRDFVAYSFISLPVNHRDLSDPCVQEARHVEDLSLRDLTSTPRIVIGVRHPRALLTSNAILSVAAVAGSHCMSSIPDPSRTSTWNLQLSAKPTGMFSSWSLTTLPSTYPVKCSVIRSYARWRPWS